MAAMPRARNHSARTLDTTHNPATHPPAIILGRDAAAVGTAGAVGEGIHHHRENERGLGSSGATSGSNTYGSTSGPHTTQTANLLDPNISGGARTTEDAHIHHPRHGGGAEAADKHHSSGGGSNTVGRDAAIGASGLGGAIGVDE